MKLKNTTSKIIIAIIAVILIILPQVITNRYLMHVLITCLIYTIVAQALNLLIGHTKYVSFGHAAFYGVGAYSSAVLVTKVGVPFGISIFLSAAIAGLIGFFCGYFPLRMRLKGTYFTIVTMAIGLVLFNIFHNWDDMTNGPAGMTGIKGAGAPFGINLMERKPYYYLVLVFAILTTVIMWRIVFSKLGRTFKAIGQDEDVAEAIGIRVGFYKIVCFTLSAFFTGLAGTLLAHYSRFISPDMFNMVEATDMVTMVVVGGQGTVVGPILGAVLIVILPELLRALSTYRQIVFSVLLIVSVVFFPEGIWGLIKKGAAKLVGSNTPTKKGGSAAPTSRSTSPDGAEVEH